MNLGVIYYKNGQAFSFFCCETYLYWHVELPFVNNNYHYCSNYQNAVAEFCHDIQNLVSFYLANYALDTRNQRATKFLELIAIQVERHYLQFSVNITLNFVFT
jgi:hypothetical protein